MGATRVSLYVLCRKADAAQFTERFGKPTDTMDPYIPSLSSLFWDEIAGGGSLDLSEFFAGKKHLPFIANHEASPGEWAESMMFSSGDGTCPEFEANLNYSLGMLALAFRDHGFITLNVTIEAWFSREGGVEIQLDQTTKLDKLRAAMVAAVDALLAPEAKP